MGAPAPWAAAGWSYAGTGTWQLLSKRRQEGVQLRGEDVALGWAPGRAPPLFSWSWGGHRGKHPLRSPGPGVGTRGASASLLPLPKQQGT